MNRNTQNYSTGVLGRPDASLTPNEETSPKPKSLTVDEWSDYILNIARDLYRCMTHKRESATVEGRVWSYAEICKEPFAEGFCQGTADVHELTELAAWLSWVTRADRVPRPLNPKVGP